MTRVRLFDTLWIIAAAVTFGVAFFAATAWALRLNQVGLKQREGTHADVPGRKHIVFG